MSKLKIGFIGTGRICQGHHLPVWAAMPDVEIFAVCDIKPDVAQLVAEKYGVKHVFADYNEMLKMDEIAAVDICTPNDVHSAAGVASLNAGKHVMVEKPIARTAAEAQVMVDAAKKTGRKLQVGQCIRFDAASQALKRFADAGDMGDVYYARAQAIRRRGVPTWGVFTSKEKQGGGPLIDLGVHILDLTLWLMGHPKPISAAGVAYNKFGGRADVANAWGPWDPDEFTVEDFAAGFIRFENGASVMVETSFAANIEKDIFNTALMGTEGGCEYSPVRMFREEHQTLLDVTPVGLPTVDRFQRELQAFADAVINDTEPPVTGEQALIVSKIMDAIYESAETGREVTID
ncbi:MAG: Gfo/Idh/MocA family oxidoreductase [Armatimonadota bacterium]|nr:Gfo/Idh/MocA family oxidoreductase [Armatimonadota bacterium]